MFFKDKNSVEILLRNVKTTENPTIYSAHLIHINGSGSLERQGCCVEDSYYGYRYLSQIVLNDIPLVQINSPGCPTCTSLLATGYGIENTQCKELKDIEKKINAPFQSLDCSIEILKPLLSLLSSGLYLIADGVCYPTDGNSNFFWNTPNELTENPATAMQLLADEDYECIGGQPIYLYPTQNSGCYNKKRVDYYMDIFKKDQQEPRAIVYKFSEFMNIILDGHHKACAAAKMKRPVKCIIIIPFSGYGYQNVNKQMIPETIYFGSVKIPCEMIPPKYLPEIPKGEKKNISNGMDMLDGIVNNREWEKEYVDSASYFPSINEYAEIVASGFTLDNSISESVIEEIFHDFNEENQRRMRTILLVMKIQKDIRFKQTAIDCTQKHMNDKLKREVYKLLKQFKNDNEVEEIFIDYLVNNTDPHDSIRSIVDSYWE